MPVRRPRGAIRALGTVAPPSALLARLRSARPSLTDATASVARCVLSDPAAASRLTITELAERAGVSTASVTRLSKTLGFEGFRAFRHALVADATRDPEVIAPEIEETDTPRDIAEKVFRADIEAIAATLDLIDEDALNRAVEALDRARSIEVYGVGSSAPVAVDAYYRLLRIGLPVAVVTDYHMQAVSASRLGTATWPW